MEAHKRLDKAQAQIKRLQGWIDHCMANLLADLAESLQDCAPDDESTDLAYECSDVVSRLDQAAEELLGELETVDSAVQDAEALIAQLRAVAKDRTH